MLILETFTKLIGKIKHKQTLSTGHSTIRINMSCTNTVSEFTNGRSETGIQNVSKILGQNFRSEYPIQKQEKSSYQRTSSNIYVQPPSSTNINSLHLYLWENLKHLAYSAAIENKATLHQHIFMPSITFAMGSVFPKSAIFHDKNR